MAFTKSQEACTISKSGLEYLCGLIRDINGLDTNLIDDLNIKSNGTFSSVRINTLLTALKTDCNDYTDSLVSNLSRLELRVVTDESDMIEHNKLYLIKKSGETSYSQYVIVTNDSGVDEKILLGTTDINMTDYYTITQADAKFTLKTDFNTLTTEVTNIKKDIGTEDISSVGTSVKDAINKLNDNKVDKTSILTAISASPSNSNLLSEKAIKSELDKKFNNADLDKLNQGTLVTETSMNKNILLWDVGHYYFNSNATWRVYEHIPSTEYAPHVYVTSVKPVKYEDTKNVGTWFRQIKVDDHLGKSFIRTIYTDNVKDVVDLENGKILPDGHQCKDTGWQRICTTSVADVPFTTINLSTKSSKLNGILYYCVKNGVCTVDLDNLSFNATGMNFVEIDGFLPAPILPVRASLVNHSDNSMVGHCYMSANNTKLGFHALKASSPGYITFSYPVKES